MSKRLEYLDALRGFAILGVIATHAASISGLKDGLLGRLAVAGGMGVQLFFVISAFTIFLTFSSRFGRETAPIRNFFTRRLLRIVPVYWLGILLYTAVYGLASRGWRDAPELWHYPMHILLINLFHPDTTSSVVPGGWSISCEIIFYLTVPLWFFLVRSARSAAVFAVLAMVIGSALVLAMKAVVGPMFADHGAQLMNQYFYRSFPSQIGCFALGILAFFLIKEGYADRLRSLPLNLAALALAAFLALLAFRGGLPYLKHHYLYSAAFAIVALALSQRPWAIAVNGPMIWLGRISYSGYLLHFLALKQITNFVPRGDMGQLAYSALIFGLGMAVTVPLAFVSFRLIEERSQHWAKATIARREATATRRAVAAEA